MGGVVNRLLLLVNTKEKLVDKLRRAKEKNDPTEYTKTRFVSIGDSFVNFETIRGVTYQGKDNPTGTVVSGGLINGVGFFKSNTYGLRYCLTVLDEIPADAPSKYWYASPSGDGISPVAIPSDSSLNFLWTDNASDSYMTTYKVNFTCNVPKFNYGDNADYENLVLTYWNSGSESDLAAIDAYLMSHALNYEDL